MKELRSLNKYLDLEADWMSKRIVNQLEFQKMVTAALNCPQNEFRTYQQVGLISGGMDSVIMWHIMQNEPGYKLAVFCDLGQSYNSAERDVLDQRQIPYVEEKLDLSSRPNWDHIIPGRNMLMMLRAVDYVTDGGNLWLGCVDGESGYDDGDKSQRFFDLFQTYVKAEYDKQVKIKTMRTGTKTYWLSWYLGKTADFSILGTVTCFNPIEGKACCACQACLRKYLAIRYYSITCSTMIECDPTGNLLEEPFATWAEHMDHPSYRQAIAVGCKPFIESYINKMETASANRNYSHYSEARIEEDLPLLQELKSDFYLGATEEGR